VVVGRESDMQEMREENDREKSVSSELKLQKIEHEKNKRGEGEIWMRVESLS